MFCVDLRINSDYFPIQFLADWFLYPRRSVFTARYGLNVYILFRSTLNFKLLNKYWRVKPTQMFKNSNSEKMKAAGIGIRKSFDIRQKNEVWILVYGMYERRLIREHVGDFQCRGSNVKLTNNELLSI